MHHGKLVYSDSIAALKQFHSGRVLLVGLNHPPTLDALAAIPGITRAESAGENLFRVHVAAGADPTERIVALAAERQWGLHQIAPAQTNLEDVFVNLTTRDITEGEKAA